MIDNYKQAVKALGDFMQEHNLVNKPQEVYNLKGDAARIAFVKNFKEVQRLKTQLDQYTDLNETQQANIEAILPKEALQEFRSSYIETAKQLRTFSKKMATKHLPEIQQLILNLLLLLPLLIMTI